MYYEPGPCMDLVLCSGPNVEPWRLMLSLESPVSMMLEMGSEAVLTLPAQF